MMRERGPLARIGFFLPAALLAASSAGCSGSSASSQCGTHGYAYAGGAVVGYGGAGWYDGSWGGGWYDPGDDGSDYGNYGYDDGTGYYDDGSYDDGSGSYDDGSGDNSSGSYDDGSGDNSSGSYDDGSGNSGSGDDGSGDDGSGDDGSGDDGTASKQHLRLQSGGTSHTQTRSARANSCYAYTCTVACAVGTRTGRVANGVSALSTDDACVAAEHGLESWAHHALGADVTACKQVPAGTTLGGTTNDDGRTPASPSVNSSSGSADMGTGGVHGIRRSPLGSR
ncbi:MAG: hypothetical protein ABI551_26990 [Polyangiaceae bacterium]